MIKDLIKKLLYQSGFLTEIHRRRNKSALTVVLFHRVFPVSDDRYLQADMEWTVTDVFFRDCMQFFKQYYNVIDLSQLQNFIESGTPLPAYSLLVTFDDGWADNLEYALPITQQFAIRPLLLVTTGAIGKPILSWQELLYSAWRINLLQSNVVKKISAVIQQPVDNVITEQDIRSLIQAIQHCPERVRDAAVELIDTISLPHSRQMLNTEQLNQLAKGFDLGTHGVRHEPLTQSENPGAELQQVREQLQEMTGQPLALSMSFPHGRHNDDVMQITKNVGYTMIFTGIQCHTQLKPQTPAIFGRHNMNQLMFQDVNGRLRPELLALYLFRQPVKNL